MSQSGDIMLEMSIDAQYQAIPYEPLVARAMVDREAAEAIQFFPELATANIAHSRHRDDPIWRELAPLARQLVRDRPGILDRTFSTRAWDAVYWSLARNRRETKDRDPGGLAEIAVFGAESFHCGGTATQGIPLRWVPPATAAAVAAYVDSMVDTAQDVFDAEAMMAAGVYKSPWDRDHSSTYWHGMHGCIGSPPS